MAMQRLFSPGNLRPWMGRLVLTLGCLLALSAQAAEPSGREPEELQAVDQSLNALRARVEACDRMSAGLEWGLEPRSSARPPLRWDPRLQEAAQRQVDAMARTRVLDHIGMDGSTVRERARAAGYGWQTIGENLAAGQQDLDAVLRDWLASDAHCAALMDARFTEFGLARQEARHPFDAFRTYWVLVLGAPEGGTTSVRSSAP